jgi:hypothetical protein
MDRIPGADTAAMKTEIERLRSCERAGARKAALIGLGFVAASAATALTLGGLAQTIAPIVCAGGAAMSFLVAWGGNYNNRFYQETGEMVDRWSRVATAPPVAPGDWLKTLPAADPTKPATKQEVLDLMAASRGYLAANLDQPGHAAALQEVERDLAALGARPEVSLSDVQSNLKTESTELRKKMFLVGCGAMAGIIGGFCTLPFVGAVGLLAGTGVMAGLTGIGQLMLRKEQKQLTLNRHLTGWEKQLQQLKDISAEVHKLAAPGATAGIKKQAGYLLVGGVRVPVASA